MFETLSHFALQQYWWVIVSLLGGILVFLLFVQGGQTLIYTIGKDEMQRKMIVNSLGRKWEFTFTTLVTFGGAIFASFPLFYSTSFGGAYWVWMAILLCFVIQAIAYEFRSKPNNFLGQRTYEIFLYINGALGTILLGIAVATFFTGANFNVDKINLVEITTNKLPVISTWEGPAYGLEAVLNFQNVALGLTVFFLARILGLLYFINNINNEDIIKRSKKHLLFNTIPFLIFFLFFVIKLLLIDGFAVNPENKEIFMESNKYLKNFKQMPLTLVIFLIGVVLVLFGIIKTLYTDSHKGIWFSGIGTILTVFILFIISGFNNTAFYPSLYNLQSSLTIENSSSSKFTLTVMSYVSLLIPFVFAYIYYAWRSINNKKIDVKEMDEETHLY